MESSITDTKQDGRNKVENWTKTNTANDYAKINRDIFKVETERQRYVREVYRKRQ
jgi:hypothetical protein